MYPLRVKQDGLLTVGDGFWPSLPEEAWEELGPIMQKYDIDGGVGYGQKEVDFVTEMIEENADRMTPEEIATFKQYARQGNTGVTDTSTPKRFEGMDAGNHTILFPGNEDQIRSVNAAFDPQYKGSNIMGNADPRLLAGTAAGTAGLLAAPMVKDSGMISAPRSEGLMSFTMGARDLERRLGGSPASLLFPEGLINYLETTNRRTEDPNAKTRAMALLDFL